MREKYWEGGRGREGDQREMEGRETKREGGREGKQRGMEGGGTKRNGDRGGEEGESKGRRVGIGHTGERERGEEKKETG